MNYRWYLELQLWCRLCALIRHGLEDQAPRKYVVRLGFALSDELNRERQWPTPAESARRVSSATAARRQRSVRAGHDAPGRAFITASARPSHPAPHFPISAPSSSPQRQPSSARTSAVAVANANSPSLLLHPGNASTSTPATHCLLPCSLTELGKPQRRATPRRNSSATLRHRGPANSDHRMPRLSAQ